MRKTLVCLSGTLCDEKLWHSQEQALASTHHCVFPSISTHTDVRALAKSILDTLPEIFTLAGMSAGAVVAFEILRQAPKRVEKICIISGNPGEITPDLKEKIQSLYDTVVTDGIDKTFREILLPISLDASNQTDAMYADLICMANRVGVSAYENQVAMLMTRQGAMDILTGLDIPVLAVCGESDRICPVAGHQAIVDTVHNGTLVVLPNTGHYINWENPIGLNTALENFLK